MLSASRVRSVFVLLVLTLALGSCGEPPAPELDGGRGDAAAPACTADGDCDDGVFCNGAERCEPGAPRASRLGCVNGAPPCIAGQTCDEVAAACRTQCETTDDADGDGARAVECGGDDCDDADATRRPAAVEICDGDDEDCDDRSFGDRDVDADGHVDAACCNGSECGDDCDDGRSNVHREASEVCDGIDNDCNGVLDGPLEDRDRDGYVDPSCAGADCDDEDPSIHPGASELCDGADTNCDGMPFEDELDLDGDGFVASTTCTSATLDTGDCDDGIAELSPDGVEACNARDDDCDGTIDETLAACDGVVAIAAGYEHTCALRRSGEVWCWGSNAHGQLGDGTGIASLAPVRVALPGEAVALAVAARHACTIDARGEVWCWGRNTEGQLGDGSTTDRFAPVRAGTLAGAVDLAAGEFHACAALADGSAWCWGENGSGRLGDGTTTRRLAPARVVGVDDAVSVAAGADFSCAVRAGGGMRCWGANARGQLGDGTTGTALVPVGVAGVTDAIAADAGTRHTCALRAGGRVSCWGANNDGQLGDGTLVDAFAPGDVESGPYVELVALGSSTCARAAVGDVLCWGTGVEGVLGNGGESRRVRPTRVSGIDDAVAIGGDSLHACAVRASGTVECWGTSANGQLGDGRTSVRAVPTPMAGVGDAVALDAGFAHVCVLRPGGVLECAGNNHVGQLADGTTAARPELAEVTGGHTWASVSAGSNHTCAIDGVGAAWCWGSGSSGEVGDGTTVASRTTPVAVTGGLTFTRLEAGASVTCGLLAGDDVRCWGALSNGPSSGSSPVPLAVSTLPRAVDLALAHGNSMVAVTPSGGALAFGNASGDVGSLTGVVAASVGNGFGCVVAAAGAVWCWGNNAQDQLGRDTGGASTTTPGVVPGLVAIDVASTGASTCALEAGGTVRCWGRGVNGQLGDGRLVGSRAPVLVRGLADAVQIASLVDAICARRATGEVSCWGIDRYGELATGAWALRSLLPVEVAGLGP